MKTTIAFLFMIIGIFNSSAYAVMDIGMAGYQTNTPLTPATLTVENEILLALSPFDLSIKGSSTKDPLNCANNLYQKILLNKGLAYTRLYVTETKAILSKNELRSLKKGKVYFALQVIGANS